MEIAEMVIEINAELYRLQHSPFISNFARETLP